MITNYNRLMSFVIVHNCNMNELKYSYTWMGVVVVVYLSRWYNLNALSYQLDFLHGDWSWLACLNPNSGANFTHADRPDQPNLYFWDNNFTMGWLGKFTSIWFKFWTNVIGKPLNRNQMFEVAATIFRPTSPTNQNRPIAKIFIFCVFHPIGMKFGVGANNGPKTT